MWVAILDFLYFGETNVEQENLEAFLALAEELRLKGLTGPSNETKYDFEELLQKKIPQIKLQTESVPNEETPMDFHRPHKEKAFSSEMPIAMVQQDMMDLSENMLPMGNRRVREAPLKFTPQAFGLPPS